LKILLINTRYFVSGGPERYLFNLEALLREHGHEVIPFAVDYAKNEPTPYKPFFPRPLGGADDVYFREHSHSASSYLRTLERAFYSPSVYRRLKALIEQTKPDVALVLHYLRKLSPSVLKCLSDCKVPFLVRLSDFAMICPNGHMIRDAQPCELCIEGSLRHSVRYRCVQGSLGASLVNYAATRFHRLAGYYDLIPKFIAPTRFTVSRLLASGIDEDRVVHIPTFVEPASSDSQPPATDHREPIIAYAGRLDHIKGPHLLLEAVRNLVSDGDRPLDPEVRIAGTGPVDYVDRLRDFAALHGLDKVTFLGDRTRPEVAELLRSARCSVVPSLWYENLPNAALESMAEATPVVAPNHGCFPELIEDRASGRLVAPASASALAAALRELLLDGGAAAAMGRRAAEFVQRQHSPDRHYERLMAAIGDLDS
jgi:glycosyltransferase involved in cell wall biosynthesis